MSQTLLAPDVIHSFMAVVIRCLRATLDVDAVVAAVGEPHAAASIAVALDIGGDLRGPVTWVFPPEIALELVRRLMADPHPPSDSAHDGATELANILTGQASEVLEANGFRCEIGVPRIHIGAPPPGLNVRMTTAAGPIDVVLSLTSGATS